MSRPSPLVGHNTAVEHRETALHIQTEDSGVGHPHVITHLFAEGGRIIATRRTSYAEHVDTPAYPGVVRDLIRAQHKAMYLALRRGELDALIDEARGSSPVVVLAPPPPPPPPVVVQQPTARPSPPRRSPRIAAIVLRDATQDSLAEIILRQVAPEDDP